MTKNVNSQGGNRFITGQSPLKDLEAWWSVCNNKLEAAVGSDNCRELIQLIGVTGTKKSVMGKKICEDDGMPINNIHQHLGRWMEFFEEQSNGLVT